MYVRQSYGGFDFVVSPIEDKKGKVYWEYHMIPKCPDLFSWLFGSDKLTSSYYYDDYNTAVTNAIERIDEIKRGIQ